ncbi:MAG: putative Cytochrome c-type protein [Bryobacterales bacterium]|nr:putative Cytochrome c-type protein [Bryobacterales bacterium]
MRFNLSNDPGMSKENLVMSRASLALIVFGCFTFIAGCRVPPTSSIPDRQVPEGDPIRGRAIVASGAHGCTGCHAIPGIRARSGVVGPPLGGMAQRSFIAGQLPNTPNVLVEFLQDPPALVPRTGMPDVRVSLEEARDIAAYLYTLDAPHDP